MHTFLPCHDIVEHIGGNNTDMLLVTSVLLSAHIITGCDTVSYIYRRGEKLIPELALQNMDQLKPLADYGAPGNLHPIGENVFQAASAFYI